VIGLLDEASAGCSSEEEEEALELALTWVLKLGQELLGRRCSCLTMELPNALAAFCQEAWAATGRRAVSWGLHASCSGLVTARRHTLELGLALCEVEVEVETDDAGDGAAAAALSWDGLALLTRCLLEEPPADIAEAAEEQDEESSDDAERCSLMLTPHSRDLLPYRLALLGKTLWRVGERALAAAKSGAAADAARAWERLAALLRCPLRLQYMAAAPGAGGDHGRAVSSPLVAALLDHDDLLLGTLNDLQRLTIALLTAAGPHASPLPHGGDPEEHALLAGFVQAMSPPVLFASLLEVVDEGLLLEYLVSNETRALEYVMRSAKFLLWCCGRQRQGAEEGGAIDPAVVVEVGEFLVGLGERLRALASRRLFPYDIKPLLERLGELRGCNVT
jgi:hypothetical protein